MKKITMHNSSKNHLWAYFSVISLIYQNHPLIIEMKKNEIMDAFDSSNPYLKNAKIENFLICSDGKPIGHASVILDKRLSNDVAMIGFFEAVDLVSGKHLLDEIKKYLKLNKIKIARGPINLSTWQNFRFSLSEEVPPFFGEPFNKNYYCYIFEKSGFEIAQENVSLVDDLQNPLIENLKKKYLNNKKQFTFLKLNTLNLEEYKRDLYALAKQTFSKSWNFVPISFKEFNYNFKNLYSTIDDHFLYIVKYGDEKAGFLLGLKDIFSKEIVIAKTMGIKDTYQRKGIGSALFYLLSRDALEKGCKKIIYSTLRTDNEPIQKLLNSNTAKVYRQYKTFEIHI